MDCESTGAAYRPIADDEFETPLRWAREDIGRGLENNYALVENGVFSRIVHRMHGAEIRIANMIEHQKLREKRLMEVLNGAHPSPDSPLEVEIAAVVKALASAREASNSTRHKPPTIQQPIRAKRERDMGITKPLEPHQYQLIVEFNELDAKVRKLEDFMVSPAFNDIDKAEQSRIRVQRGIMLQYIGILTMRINDSMNPGTEEEVKRFLYGADNAVSVAEMVAEMVVEKGRLSDENERLRRELNEALVDLEEIAAIASGRGKQ